MTKEPRREKSCSYLDRCYSFATRGTLWCKHSMIIIDTVNFVVNVHRKWNSVQTLVADAASEASRMIRLAHRL